MVTRTSGGKMGRTELLVESLGRRIVNGEFQPGAALPIEPDLAAAFNAGRNVVREAVKVLAGKGFIRTERRVGTIVQPRSNWAMLDPQVLSWMLLNPETRAELLVHLSDVRRIIEPEAAALAARNASVSERLRLVEAFETMSAYNRDRERAIIADIAFHDRLFDASHNPLLITIARSIDVLLRANFEIAMETSDGYIRNLAQHGEVAEAINDRDEARARAGMLTLLLNNDADLRETLQR